MPEHPLNDPTRTAYNPDASPDDRIADALKLAASYRYLYNQASRHAANEQETLKIAEAALARTQSRLDVVEAIKNRVQRELDDTLRQLNDARPDDPARLLRLGAVERRRHAKLCTGAEAPTGEKLRLEADTLDAAASVIEGNLDPLYHWLPSYQWTDAMRTAIRLGPEGGSGD